MSPTADLLTKKDLTEIKAALFKLRQVAPVIDLLEKLGQDVSEFRSKVKSYEGLLTTLRTEVFPETP